MKIFKFYALSFGFVLMCLFYLGCQNQMESNSKQQLSNQTNSLPKGQASNPEESDPDQQVLDQMKAAGSNLNKPHNVEFYLYFPTEQSANYAAEEIRKEGLNVKVRLGADESSWLCLAKMEMTPKYSEFVRLRVRFNEIAQKFKGDYDGWETDIVK